MNHQALDMVFSTLVNCRNEIENCMKVVGEFRDKSKLDEFLNSLDDTVYGQFKTDILSRVPLPSVEEALEEAAAFHRHDREPNSPLRSPPSPYLRTDEITEENSPTNIDEITEENPPTNTEEIIEENPDSDDPVVETVFDYETCFSVHVTDLNIRQKLLRVPMVFARRHGLDGEGSYKIVLVNEERRSRYKTTLEAYTLHNRVFIKMLRHGITHPCRFVFKLLPQRDGEGNIMFQIRHGVIFDITGGNTIVHFKPTRNSLKIGKQNIPLTFTNANRFGNHHEVTLVDKFGNEWVMHLKQGKPNMYIMGGNLWRLFCETNRINVGDTFPLKLKLDEDGNLFLCWIPRPDDDNDTFEERYGSVPAEETV